VSEPPTPGPAWDIDRVCDEFEGEWRAGRRPDVEPYLARVAAAQKGDLLRELLALELEYRRRAGERPVLGEYQQRFPDQTEAVRTAFTRPGPAVPAPSAQAEASPTRLTLTAIEGPHKGQVFTFAGHEIFLAGRSKQAHLQVTDGYCSRFHFMVEINPPDCRLNDMGSRNGTTVNGRRVQTADLRDGDVIGVGHTALVVGIAAPATEVGGATAAEDHATLDLPAGEVPPILAPLTQPATAPPGAMTLDLPGTAAVPPTVPETRFPSAAGSGVSAGGPAVPETRFPTGVSTAGPLGQPQTGFPGVAGYRIARELGRGGMGVVYLAVREASGAQVALKTIIPTAAAKRSQVDRFLREADILKKLDHPNIVAFRDVGETDGCLFFAMDYVEGTDASRLLKQQGPLPVRMAVRIVCQLLAALDYAHSKGFVHRDIKPANLLIAEDGGKKLVKLADFGLARVYQESRMSGLTMQGDVGGTVAYMPPEQITQFRQVKPAADQYSAAATLYTLLTGQVLFDFKAASVQPFAVVLQEEPVPIRDRRGDVPEEIAVLVHRALAKDPAARFPDVRSFRAALKPFAQ
jgi:pSer/pThr/pTyr-binding forkhead associated (FHA) protein